jgi:hypothetical protein
VEVGGRVAAPRVGDRGARAPSPPGAVVLTLSGGDGVA